MSYEPDSPSAGTRRAAESTNVPGIFLIIVGAINVLAAIWFIYLGIQVSRGGGQFQQQLAQDPMQQKNLRELEKQGMSLEGVIKGYSTAFLISGVLGIL